MNRLLLSLDPSSTCTGYAALDRDRTVQPGNFPKLIEHGLLTPKRKTDPANDRIREMIDQIRGLIHKQQPGIILIEDTSGKVSSRHGSGGGAGLAIYGKAIGWILATCEAIVANPMSPTPAAIVVPILENTWSRGAPKKIQRQLICEAAYPGVYNRQQDPGGDAADAIRMAHWWIESERLKEYYQKMEAENQRRRQKQGCAQ